ncbi:MAG: hypothetical protein V4726_00865 [Verrucomicrobiota bacterium]
MAETWLTINDDSVREALADGEYDAFSALALTAGASVVPGCIRRTVNRVRGAVAASGKYALGPEGTVPPELESATIHLLRRELATRLPQSGIDFDDLRKDGLRDAENQLQEVREGHAGISPPETLSPSSPASDAGAWGSENQIIFGDGPP